MDAKQTERLQARNLFFETELTQQQIAGLLNINRKTLHLWVKEGGWQRAKYAAAHAPSVLVDQYYHQLGAINRNIARRTDQPWPTMEEADVIRKITATINHLKKGRNKFCETIEVFQSFTETMRREEKNLGLLKEIILPMDKHVKSLMNDGSLLSFSGIQEEELRSDKEYAEWLAAQARTDENPAPATPPTSGMPAQQEITQTGAPGTSELTAVHLSPPDGTGSSQPMTDDLQLTPNTPPPATDGARPVTEVTMGHPSGSQNTDNEQSAGNLPTEKTGNGASPQVSATDAFIQEKKDNPDSQPPTPDSQPPAPGIQKTAAYYATLPPAQRPSPFREGNILWVNSREDIICSEMKMGDSVRNYTDMDPLV